MFDNPSVTFFCSSITYFTLSPNAQSSSSPEDELYLEQLSGELNHLASVAEIVCGEEEM
jgi:hypothetical protein